MRDEVLHAGDFFGMCDGSIGLAAYYMANEVFSRESARIPKSGKCA
jgi:hypothetical protein